MSQFTRFASVYFTRFFFGVLLVLLPTTFLFTFFFSDPGFIKQTLRESKAYTAFSDIVVTQTTSAFSTNAGNYGVSQSATESAAKKALSPTILQEKIEQNIDEAYSWLYGEQDTYTPDINLEDNQRIFMQEIARVSSEEVMKKPECTQEYLQQTSAQQGGQLPVITELPCRPAGYDQATLEAQLSESLQNSVPSNPQDQAALQGAVDNSPGSESAMVGDTTTSIIPIVFQVMSKGFYLVIIGIFFIIGIYYMLHKKSFITLAAVAKPLVTTGILLAVYGIISWWLTSQNIVGKLAGQDATNSALQNSMRPFADLTLTVFAGFGVVYIVCALILFFIHRRLRARQAVKDALDSLQQPPTQTTV